MPACSLDSSREPARTQKPSATDRTEGTASDTTRTPESSVVRRARSVTRPTLAIAAATALAIPAAPAAAVAAVPPPAAAAARALVARAHRGELLGRLPGDVGILRQAQADAATLAVDLDHLDRHLVAAVDDVLDGVHALPR